MISEAIGLRYILIAAVRFPESAQAGPDGAPVVEPPKLLTWPEFLQFPEDALLVGRRTLVVDDVWGSGRTITAVRGRVEAAGGHPELCVLHYNPYRSLFPKHTPNYYAAITDAYIVYPWELPRGPDMVAVRTPE
jgi:hypoxanthine phosphoribosyltransferase